MANPEHVEIVRKGAEEIRKWREKNPSVRLNLNEADIRGVNLSEADLCGVNLDQTNLCGTKLPTCPLCDKPSRVIGECVECSCCGMYLVSINDIDGREDRHLLSGWCRERWEFNHGPIHLASEEVCSNIAALAPKRIPEKALSMLRHIERLTDHFGQWVRLNISDDWSRATPG